MQLEKMKVAELKELAVKKDIDPSGMKKADLIAAITEADEPIEVEAETIDGEMIQSKPFAIDMTKVQSDIDVLTTAIDDALVVYEEFKTNQETMDDMSAQDLAICEDALSKALKNADDARLQLGRDYRKPLDEANARYKELTGPAIELKDAYAERRQELRRDGLEQTYIDFCEANGMESLPQVVPFQRLLDAHPQWMRRDANAGKSAQKVEETARGIIDDWGALASQKASMRFYDEAESEFFKTLDLSAAMRLNRERTAEHERIEAARAEREAVMAYRGEEREAETTASEAIKHAPETNADAGQRRRYTFSADLTESELASLREWKNACGIGANWMFGRAREAEREVA